MRTRRGLPAVAAALAALALLAAGCGTPNPTAQSRLEGHGTGHATGLGATHGSTDTTAGAGATTSGGHAAAPVTPARVAALRTGETMRTVTSPVAYTPKAPTTGTDDYRCFVLDPKLAKDAFVTGFDIAPGQPAEVHHVILFRVPPPAAAAARARDAESG